MTDEKSMSSSEWADGKMTFPLSRPIKAHGNEMSSIEIREPNGADMIAVGNPVHFDPLSDPPRLLPDAAKMAQMIARLAAVRHPRSRRSRPRSRSSFPGS